MNENAKSGSLHMSHIMNHIVSLFILKMGRILYKHELHV